MGSFNVADPIIGSIRQGDPAVLVLLVPNNSYYGNTTDIVSLHPTSNIVTNDGACSFYVPIGVLSGEYADYGELQELANEGTGAAIANHFGISVDELMKIVTCDREPSDYYSETARILMEKDLFQEMEVTAFSEDFWEKAGFERVDARTFEHPQCKDVTIQAFSRDEESIPSENTATISAFEVFKRSEHSRIFLLVKKGDGTEHCRIAYDFGVGKDICEIWKSATNYDLGYTDQHRLKALKSISGMWMHGAVWDLYTSGLFDSDNAGPDSALRNSRVGCCAYALTIAGFQCLGKDDNKQRYKDMYVLPGFEKTSSGEDIRVGSDRTWIRLFIGDQEYTKESLFSMDALANAYSDLCLRKPDFSILDKPIGRFQMDELVAPLSGRDEVFLLRDSFWSNRSIWWDPFKRIYHPLLAGDPLIQRDLVALYYLRTNFYLTSKYFAPTMNGPQFGDLRAEMYAAKKVFDIVRARVRNAFDEIDPSDLEDGNYEVLDVYDGLLIFALDKFESGRMDENHFTNTSTTDDPKRMVLEVKDGRAMLTDKPT